jgi:hypothetical protein
LIASDGAFFRNVGLAGLVLLLLPLAYVILRSLQRGDTSG